MKWRGWERGKEGGIGSGGDGKGEKEGGIGSGVDGKEEKKVE